MVQAVGARHINAAMNGGNPRRTGKRTYHTGGTQNRDTTFDAQTRVPCLESQISPARHSNFDNNIAGAGKPFSKRINRILHHLARHRIDCRLTHRHWQTGFGDHPDPFTALKMYTGAIWTAPECCGYQRPMRHIGIISCILDDTGRKPAGPYATACLGTIILGTAFGINHFQISIFAAWCDNCDAIRKLASHQRRVGCVDGSGRTGARCPAKTEIGLQFVFPDRGPGHSRRPIWQCPPRYGQRKKRASCLVRPEMDRSGSKQMLVIWTRG